MILTAKDLTKELTKGKKGKNDIYLCNYFINVSLYCLYISFVFHQSYSKSLDSAWYKASIQ